MSESGSAHVDNNATVYGSVVGENRGTINTTYNLDFIHCYKSEYSIGKLYEGREG